MDLSTLTNMNAETVAGGVAAVSGVCAWICTLLSAPTASSGTFYRVVYGLLNWLGGNKGKARNADDVAGRRL